MNISVEGWEASGEVVSLTWLLLAMPAYTGRWRCYIAFCIIMVKVMMEALHSLHCCSTRQCSLQDAVYCGLRIIQFAGMSKSPSMCSFHGVVICSGPCPPRPLVQQHDL
jgi:hypothetical protein